MRRKSDTMRSLLKEKRRRSEQGRKKTWSLR
jgi:hypothetical protein